MAVPPAALIDRALAGRLRLGLGRLGLGRAVALYGSVALVAGALIALQLAIMRIFAVGSWAHFGSLVVSLAMLGFGLSSAAICVARPFVERHGRRVVAATLIVFAPVLAIANLAAQEVPFNAVFMLSDPQQKWRLAANFVLYLMPFLVGAMFLGTIFLQNGDRFGRVYFADLSGAGACGLVFVLAMYVVPPADLIVVPLALELCGAALWIGAYGGRIERLALVLAIGATALIQFGVPPAFDIPKLAVSDYKGVAYARKFPDSRRVLHELSPYGDLQVYASSYLHFAPGLSDNAAFNLARLPDNAYLGLYLDGEGPTGILRDLPAGDTRYFHYLPMVYPYLLAAEPDVFVVQFGGGISTNVALRNGARSVTVAESNPAVLQTFERDPQIAEFTGHLLQNPRVRAVGNEGRLTLQASGEHYDIVDLSLGNSVGLSSPGGFSIVERYAHTQQAMLTYMRALKPGGILAVTLWNKEEPPKSVLKLYITMVAAARSFDAAQLAQSFYAVSNYLSTTTVLYKFGGFSAGDLAKLRDHSAAMSFDPVYDPGIPYDPTEASGVIAAYRDQIFAAPDVDAPPAAGPDPTTAPVTTLPSTAMARLAWHHLMQGDWAGIAADYVFDVRPLTDDRPYFAGYIKPGDLPRIVDRLEVLQDEWGYLLLWVTLAVAVCGAALLMALPLVFGWRTMVEHFPGKLGTVVYFACLGLGYIVVEVGLVSKFALPLSNYTIAAAVVITGMLVFSGLGSLASEACLGRARIALPRLLGAVGSVLAVYALAADPVLDWIGTMPALPRLACCFCLILPPAFLMGFPMPLAMTTLARLGKGRLFMWAWGINGCFSVIGAALVPIVATAFGLDTVLAIGAGAYLVAIPAVSALFRPGQPIPRLA